MSASNPKPFMVQQVMIGGEATLGTEALANDMKTTNVHPFDYSGLEAVALENRRAHMRGTLLKPFVGMRTGRITLSQDFHGYSDSTPSGAPTVSDAPVRKPLPVMVMAPASSCGPLDGTMPPVTITGGGAS